MKGAGAGPLAGMRRKARGKTGQSLTFVLRSLVCQNINVFNHLVASIRIDKKHAILFLQNMHRLCCNVTLSSVEILSRSYETGG
jgi:hypothetical protein